MRVQDKPTRVTQFLAVLYAYKSSPPAFTIGYDDSFIRGWLQGFYAGEGSFLTPVNGKRIRYARVQVVNTDPDLI